jgi:hypothetical protein
MRHQWSIKTPIAGILARAIDDPDRRVQLNAWKTLAEAALLCDANTFREKFPGVDHAAEARFWSDDTPVRIASRQIYQQFHTGKDSPSPPVPVSLFLALVVYGIVDVVAAGLGAIGLLRGPPSEPLLPGKRKRCAVAGRTTILCGISLILFSLLSLLLQELLQGRPRIQPHWWYESLFMFLATVAPFLWGAFVIVWGKNILHGRLLDTIISLISNALTFLFAAVALAASVATIYALPDAPFFAWPSAEINALIATVSAVAVALIMRVLAFRPANQMQVYADPQ